MQASSEDGDIHQAETLSFLIYTVQQQWYPRIHWSFLAPMIPTGHCRYDASILFITKYNTTRVAHCQEIQCQEFPPLPASHLKKKLCGMNAARQCGPQVNTAKHKATQSRESVTQSAGPPVTWRSGGHPAKVGFVAKVAGGFVDKLIPNPPPLTPPSPPTPPTPLDGCGLFW